MSSSHQVVLNRRGLGTCQVASDNGVRRIIPCGYHRDRAENVIMRLDPLRNPGGDLQQERTIEPTACFIELAKRLDRHGAPPAGGWYLVAEQRNWLIKQLSDAISVSTAPEVRILEAGIASHNHHYSYLDLVSQALQQATRKPKIHVIVVDKCEYPIALSRAIRDELILKPGVGEPLPALDDAPTEPCLSFVLSRRNAGQYAAIEQSFIVGDLQDPQTLNIEPKSIDIITEHFITAVIRNLDLLASFRSAYSKLLRPGGRLLTAYGATLASKEKEFEEIQGLHRRFDLIPRPYTYVWDPYGLKENDLHPLLKKDPTSVTISSENSVQLFEMAG